MFLRLYAYESTKKFRFIAVKHGQTLDWNILTTLFSFHFKETQHLSCAQLSYVQIFSQYAM